MKTIDEINEKIRSGKVVVATAEELIKTVKENGLPAAAKKIDVVTTATFGAMCSSGAIINFGHSDPPIRMSKITLNGVEAYGGLAAVDTYIGATQPGDTDEYGGAHVIEDLVSGKQVTLKALSNGTDCYPRKEIDTQISLETVNQAYLFNPRNAYQNYAAATNSSEKTIKTYMGTLLPNYGNVTFSTSGELSPLLKDPDMRTIGVGTKIFIGGAQGYIAWDGTQSTFNSSQLENGFMWHAGATLALVGDLKKMNRRYLRAGVYDGYGVSLFVGVGIPIPVLDEELCAQLAVDNSRLFTRIYDYSIPARTRPSLRTVSYQELFSGHVELNGRKTPAASLSSISRAREIAGVLKQQITSGEFLLTNRVKVFDRTTNKPLEIRK